jgi:CelD/BcsL family acetyltransferase involved in cellulose biosynthesis
MSGACFSPESRGVARPSGVELEEACRVTVLRPAELAALVPQWEELAQEALEPNPFYEHWILLPALEAFAAGQDVRVVAVWFQDRLWGLFPLERVARYRGLPVPALRTWRHRHSLLCTPLIRAGRAAQCLAALSLWLRSVEGAPLLELDFVPAEGPFHRALVDWLHEEKRPSLASNRYNRAVLRKAADAERYFSGLPAKLVRDLKRRERRLAERGALTHAVLGPQGDLERWLDDLMQLEAAGWKGRQGSALASNEVDRRFAQRIFREAFRRGRLLIAGVDLDGKPLARCSSFLAGEGAFAFKTAYDEQFAAFSPGVIAEMDRIRAFHELPAAQWMDSFTAPGNDVLDRLWKDRLTVQRLVVGTALRGELALAALPLLGFVKRLIAR